MKDNNYLLQKFESVCLILIIMINRLILNVPYYVVLTVGSGSLVNLVYIGIIGFLFVLLLIKLFEKFEGSDIIDISEYLGGKSLKVILSILITLFFIIVSFITLSDFANMLQVIYLYGFKKIYIVLFFIIRKLNCKFSRIQINSKSCMLCSSTRFN